MRIIQAPHNGCCSGVKRALALAEQAAAHYGRIETLGPLIHNPQQLSRLAPRISAVESLEQLQGTALLLRAHGAAPAVLAAAQARNITVIDGTCPKVRRLQLLARQYAEAGWQVVIVGDAEHAEVRGVCGWANDRALVVRDAEQAASIPAGQRIALLAQTTEREENFRAIADILQQQAVDFISVDTICDHTRLQQQETAELAREADIIIVLGGKNSSNTQKLAQISGETGKPVFHIETPAELDIDIVRSARVVAIAAGASTPEHIIEEVLERMTELEKLETENAELMTDQAEQAEQAVEENAALAEQAAEEDAGEAALHAEADVKEAVQEHDSEPGAPDEYEPAEPADSQAPEAPEEAALHDCDEEEAPAVKSEADTFAEEYGDMKEIRRGARVKGVVVQVKDDELLVDIGGKSEGVLSSSELSTEDAKNIRENFHIGDEIDVLILRKENQEGYPVLSKRRVDQDIAWDRLAQLKQDKAIVTGMVTDVVKGGVLVDVGIRGFVPASLVALGYVEDLSAYVGKELQMKIIECDKHSNKLVLSAKAVLRRASQAQKEQTWAEVAEGQTRKGVVRRLTSFGAFVDIGGVDGLLHVSEMAWYRVNHPADLLKEGDEIEVYILGADRENEKISLGMKQLIPNPWVEARDKYPEGCVIPAKVMRTTDFGAFLEVEPGVEGLVHISQMAHHRVEKTEDVVKPGDLVQVKVISVDPEAKRMSLSIKATLPPEEEAPMFPDSEEEPAQAEQPPEIAAEEIVAEEPAVEEAAVEEAAAEEPAAEEAAAEEPAAEEPVVEEAAAEEPAVEEPVAEEAAAEEIAVEENIVAEAAPEEAAESAEQE